MIGERKIAAPMMRDGVAALVIDPTTGLQVPPAGVPVTVDVFWFRRYEAGDIDLLPIQTEPEPETTPAPVEEPQKAKRQRGARGEE
jgi:hypothetical protein